VALMDAIGLASLLPYLGIVGAAIVEGEIAYIGAAALVAHGRLHPVGVLLSGALGATIGDQTYFYLFRGRLPRWLARYPTLWQKAAPLVDRVRRHDVLMVLLIRFAPGLRIALAAACASAELSPVKFSILNATAALAWASVLLVLVGWWGPTYLARYGLSGWKGALLMGLAILLLFKALGSYERRLLARATSR
jgi:membrane protein DedA with SNARE-associated domain